MKNFIMKKYLTAVIPVMLALNFSPFAKDTSSPPALGEAHMTDCQHLFYMNGTSGWSGLSEAVKKRNFHCDPNNKWDLDKKSPEQILNEWTFYLGCKKKQEKGMRIGCQKPSSQEPRKDFSYQLYQSCLKNEKGSFEKCSKPNNKLDKVSSAAIERYKKCLKKQKETGTRQLCINPEGAKNHRDCVVPNDSSETSFSCNGERWVKIIPSPDGRIDTIGELNNPTKIYEREPFNDQRILKPNSADGYSSTYKDGATAH